MVGLRPMFRTPLLAIGLGAIAGGFEVVALGATLKLSLLPVDAAMLGLAGVVLGAVVGLVGGIPAGLVVELVTRSWFPPRRYAAGMALVSVLLGSWYLVPLGLVKVEQGLVPAGIALALSPIGVGGVVWFNAGYWFRREDIGERRRLGWWFVGPCMGLALGALGTLLALDRDHGSARALAGDPLVVLVGVDGLRADHVGALAADAPVSTPSLDALVAAGLAYDNVVAPVPAAGPAQAALMTGRHPVRAGVVRASDRLLRGYDTAAEAFAGEGYATGAFVTSPELAAGRGFEQGFEVWDDDPAMPVRGLARLQVVRFARAAGLHVGPLASVRSDAETVAQVAPWLEAVGERPALVWVQLEGPARATDRDSLARALGDVDALVGRLRTVATEAARGRPITFAVVGTRGQPMGEHPGGIGHANLYDESVRVPLLIEPHVMKAIQHRRVSLQVRLMDVPAALLALCRLDPLPDAEGADLIGFAQGLRTRHYASLLALARSDAEGGLLLGYRATRGGEDGNIKFILEHRTGRSRLFDLVEDPEEETDIAESQGEAVAAIRARVLQEAGPLFRD